MAMLVLWAAALLQLEPWECRRYVRQKRRWNPPTPPHSVTAQKTNNEIFTALRISDLQKCEHN